MFDVPEYVLFLQQAFLLLFQENIFFASLFHFLVEMQNLAMPM
jgi:hypothetical protein